MSLSRRELLVGFGSIGVAGYLTYRADSSTASGGGGGAISTSQVGGARLEQYRPVAGGPSIGIEATDSVGTIAGGVEGSSGEPYALTCRHVVDPEYPDGDDSEVIGTQVYQPYHEDGAAPIGEVVDVGPSKGINSTDWALLELDSDKWTTDVLGVGAPASRAEPTVGDRVVLSGIRTGLWGGEITDVGVSANWTGTLVYDLIEYRVDDDAATAGNSGGFVGYVDADGTFRALGIHAFRVDEHRYAVPLDQPLDATNSSISSQAPEAPSAPTEWGPFVEGAISSWRDGSTATIQVANIGGGAATDRTITTEASDGTTVDSTTVTLEALEARTLELGTPSDGSPPVLQTGDVTAGAIEP